MPKKKYVNGTNAAIGMLRPKRIMGANNDFIGGKLPASIPSGIPITAASENPSTTRRRVVRILRVNCCSNQRSLKAAKVSDGLGRANGPTILSSTISPRVTNHHNPKTISTLAMLSSTDTNRLILPRIGNQRRGGC